MSTPVADATITLPPMSMRKIKREMAKATASTMTVAENVKPIAEQGLNYERGAQAAHCEYCGSPVVVRIHRQKYDGGIHFRPYAYECSSCGSKVADARWTKPATAVVTE